MVQGQSGWRDLSREAQGTDKATELGNRQLVDIRRLGVVADGKAGPQKLNVELSEDPAEKGIGTRNSDRYLCVHVDRSIFPNSRRRQPSSVGR